MEKKKRKSHKRKRQSFLYHIGIFVLILLCVLLVFGAIVFAGYFWMEKRGRTSFLEKQEALPQQMTGISSNELSGEAEETESLALEAGEIRYQGKIWTYNRDILTFLCMGIDKKGEAQASDDLYRGGQADALFLVVLDQDEKKISIVGINRDTMTEISVYDQDGLYVGKQTAQIALQHAYGDGMEESCERTVDAVSHLLFGLPIHGYCALNMEVIPIINDAVGGVDLTVQNDVYISGKRKWAAGEQIHLEGKDAFSFVQGRDTSIAQSAEDRLARQKQYLQAFVQKAMQTVKEDMTLPVKLYSRITPYMVTDITSEEVVYLAGQALSCRFDTENIYTMEGEVIMGEVYEEFYQDDTALYEMILEIFYKEKK